MLTGVSQSCLYYQAQQVESCVRFIWIRWEEFLKDRTRIFGLWMNNERKKKVINGTGIKTFSERRKFMFWSELV